MDDTVPSPRGPAHGQSTLVVVGHPDLASSRVSAAFLSALRDVPHVEIRDLYALYPDHRIDLEAERAAIGRAWRFVLQYPTYWYSAPPLLKQWLDEVLVRGWAYGTGRPGALAGKHLLVATSTGGAGEAYAPGEFHGWDFDDVLIPMKATARRLGMVWDRPLVVHAVRDLDGAALEREAAAYRNAITAGQTAA